MKFMQEITISLGQYLNLTAQGATAQQTTVQGTVVSSRYHNPGTFYLQMVGTGTGSLYFNWEERS